MQDDISKVGQTIWHEVSKTLVLKMKCHCRHTALFLISSQLQNKYSTVVPALAKFVQMLLILAVQTNVKHLKVNVKSPIS